MRAGTVTEIGEDVYCPGLGTGVGMVPPEKAATEMALAYGDWKRIAEPGAAPNGGPATQLGNSEAAEEPPSVS